MTYRIVIELQERWRLQIAAARDKVEHPHA